MKCPSCVGEIAGDSRFCAYCGITIPRCLSCGHLHPIEAGFCPQCGVPTRGNDGPINFTDSILPGEDEQWNQNNRENVVGFLFEPEFPDHRFYLQEGDATVGAGEKNSLVIDKPAISWNHAIVIIRDQKVRLQDSASTNGTFLNDAQIYRPQTLRHGDEVRFANIAYIVWIKPQLRENE